MNIDRMTIKSNDKIYESIVLEISNKCLAPVIDNKSWGIRIITILDFSKNSYDTIIERMDSDVLTPEEEERIFKLIKEQIRCKDKEHITN